MSPPPRLRRPGGPQSAEEERQQEIDRAKRYNVDASYIINKVIGEPEVGTTGVGGYEYKDVNGTPYVIGKGDESAIDPDDVLQGQTGDCWFLASVIAVASIDPYALERLIKPLGGGKYEVTLYTRDENYKKQTNKVIVDDDFPVFSSTVSGINPQSGKNITFHKGAPAYSHSTDVDARGRREIWPLLLEKAAAMVRVPTQKSYDGISGGTGREGMDMLLPDEAHAQELFLTHLRDGKTITREDIHNPLYIDSIELIETLFLAWKGGRPITAGTKSNPGYAGGVELLGGHVYAVVGVDVFAKTIDLQDPNGVTNCTVNPVEFKTNFSSVYLAASLTL